MNALNSVRGHTKTPYLAGIGVLAIAAVIFLFMAVPIFSSAQTGITVTVTATSSYGQWVDIAGTVSPAPNATGFEAGVSVDNSVGVQVIATDVNVTASGTFNYNYTGVSSFVNGSYSVTVTYAQNVNEPYYGYATLQYGAVTTTSTSSSSTTTCSTCTTTVFYNVTTTVSEQITTTVVTSSAVTTTIVAPGTVTTVQPVTTIISSVTTVSSAVSGVGTAEALGAVGIVIGIIAAVLAVMTMRKK